MAESGPTRTQFRAPPDELSRVDLLLRRIAAATQLAIDAERAYLGAGTDASRIQAEVNRAQYDLLRSLCDLTDEEADAVEPAFTDLENQLLHGAAVRKSRDPRTQ